MASNFARFSLGIIALASLAGSTLAQVPKVLIVYQGVPNTEGLDPYAALPNLLGGFLVDSGKFAAINWGMEDSSFRQAVLDGKLDVTPEDVSDRSVNRAATQLGATYIVRIRTASKDGRTLAEAQLFKGARREWQDRTEVAVMVGPSSSPFDACRSLANTWAEKLFAGPFKAIASVPIAPTPVVEPGQVRLNPVGVEPVANQPTSNEDLRKSIGDLMKGKKYSEAVFLLREAVDEAPLDLERRVLLLDALRKSGQPMLAAESAITSIPLFAEQDQLRSIAIQALLEAGDSTRAQELLNLAATKNPEDPAVRVLMGDLALGQGKPEAAKEHFAVALKAEPSAANYLRLAQCEAALGASEASLAAHKKAREVANGELAVEEDRYGSAYDQIDQAMVADMMLIRDLIPRLSVSNQRVAAARELASISARAEARTALLEVWSTGAKFAKSSQQAILAYKLYILAMEGLADYAETRIEATLLDARIDLAEALKLAREAREQYVLARGS